MAQLVTKGIGSSGGVANPYKCTVYYTHASYGWSESYWSSLSTLAALAPVLQKMLLLRMFMLPTDHSFAGVRISVVGGVRQSSLALPGNNTLADGTTVLNVPENGAFKAFRGSNSISQMRQVMQLHVMYGANLKSVRYLGGIPSDIVNEEPYGSGVDNDAAWYGAYDAWRKFLVQSTWGIMARAQTGVGAPTLITGAELGTQAAPLLGIDVVTEGAPAFARGMKVAVSHARPPKGTRVSTLNGQWTVDSVAPSAFPGMTAVYLRGSEGILPSAVRFTPASVIYGLVPVFNQIVWIRSTKAGIHKRGRPSLTPRGRRLTHTSLDP